ncbi:MAG: hypothetical protein HZA14_08680 [Nitrospirae bacterium]|nr:hypothetical protein [Nitrospirota bacterium]
MEKFDMPKEEEAKLNDGAKREACFLDIDIVGHSHLSRMFPDTIVETKINLRKRAN